MAGQVWATDSLGGYMYSLNLSKELRISLRPIVKFRQFADVKDAAHQGLNKGDTFHWNVYSTIATGGAALTENTAIPETNFTITQGTMTIAEMGNSIPFTSKLDDLSEHPVKEVIHKVLKIDAAQVLDGLVADQIDTCETSCCPNRWHINHSAYADHKWYSNVDQQRSVRQGSHQSSC